MCPWCQRVTCSVSGQLLVEIFCSGGLAPVVKAWGGRSSVPVGRVREAAQVCLSRPLALVGNHCLQKQGCVPPWNPAGARGEGHLMCCTTGPGGSQAGAAPALSAALSGLPGSQLTSAVQSTAGRPSRRLHEPALHAGLSSGPPCGAFDPTDPLGGVESGICVG